MQDYAIWDIDKMLTERKNFVNLTSYQLLLTSDQYVTINFVVVIIAASLLYQSIISNRSKLYRI